MSYEQYDKLVEDLFGYDLEAKKGLKAIKFSSKETEIHPRVIQYSDGKGSVWVMEAVGAKKG